MNKVNLINVTSVVGGNAFGFNLTNTASVH